MMDEAGLCGVDEAGRGSLAGAVYAAAVILDPAHLLAGIADSKTLNEQRRELLAAAIKRQAAAWAVASASVEEVDQLNILQATLLAMRRAVEGLCMTPQRVMVDGLHCPPLACPAMSVVQGDSKIRAIAAASILAKTARDAEMRRLDFLYPQYAFARHKGYPTAEHLAKLRQHGISAVHRRSYAPVKELLLKS